MATNVSSVPGLYSDLNASIKTSEWEKVLTVSNRILQESPEEQKAFQCKTSALIHLGKFEDCLHHLKPGKSKFGADQKFERAYSEYRLNRLNEALATLEGCETSRDQELRAQILYRLERYDQALVLYRSLVRSCADDYGEEREANMAAAFAAKAMFGGEAAADTAATGGAGAVDLEDPKTLARDTYDQIFNLACALIGRGRYKEAGDTLAEAERACREAMAEDDPEAVIEELAPIQFQQAYLAQLSGSPQQLQEARKTYLSIANAKLGDAGLLAVCANNLACANRDQNLFDSKKRIKFASGDALKQKLTRKQRQAITLNQCLVYLYSNQGDLCKRTAESLLKSDSDGGNETAALILAAQLARERATGGPKPGSQAVDFLEDLCAKRPEFIQSRLALAQLLAQSGAPRRACDALKQLPPSQLYTDRMISAVMRLYAACEDRGAAAEFLASARKHFRQLMGTSSSSSATEAADRLKALLKLSARFEQSGGNYRQAAGLFSELLQLSPNDQRLIACLVHAYAQFDPPKAEETSRLLKDTSADEAAAAASDLDADQLESSFAFGSKYATKRTAAAAAPGSPKAGDRLAKHASNKSGGGSQKPSASQAASALQQQKKKKKKGKLPKNYDPAGPDADPERWLPRRERSYYRGKKKDKHRQIARGPQGATAAAGDLDVRAKQMAASAAAAAEGAEPASSAASGGASLSPAAAGETPPGSSTKPKHSGGGGGGGGQASGGGGGSQQQQQAKKKKPAGRRW